MVKRGNGDGKPHKKHISRGESGKAPRKRREIKRKQIRKREFIRKMKLIMECTPRIGHSNKL